jgi:purine-binding chemotaxis protein CheW
VPDEVAADKGSASASPAQVQVVRFEVGGVLFGIDIMRIDEVILPRKVGPVPGQPDFVEGLFELRGNYIPQIDLRRRFGLPDAGRVGEKVLVVRCRERTLGLLVDRVAEVDRFDRGEVRTSPIDSRVSGVAPCAGVVSRDGAMLVLLQTDNLLSREELERVPGGKND